MLTSFPSGSVKLSRTQRGLMESAQFALIWPALLLISLGIVQAGIWIHAHNVAGRAANAAADAASGSYGDTASARQVAAGIAGSGGLKSVEVQIHSGGTTVEVVVSGDAPMLLQLPFARVVETAAAPIERVTRP